MWFKVDDGLAFHAKTVAAGNEAMGLWVRAGSWCGSQLNDGFVPDYMAALMASAMPGANATADALVTVGLWDRVDSGYKFHDWEQFQPSGEKAQKVKAKRAEAGRKGAEARWGNKTDSKSHADATGKTVATADAPSLPVPSQSTTPKTPPAPRPEVTDICDRLADRIAGNGVRRPTITKSWQDAARRLIDVDGYTPEEITRVIDWCQADDFWKSNILSMTKLREKFTALKLKADNVKTRPQTIPTGRPSEGSWMIPRKAG